MPTFSLSRKFLAVALGVLTSMLVPGWVAWQSLDELATQALTAREADASLAAHHIEGVLAREWNKLQEIAAAPATATATAVEPTSVPTSVSSRRV